MKIIDQFISHFSNKIVKGSKKMKPTNICSPTIINMFLLLLKKFPNNNVAPAKANNAAEHNKKPNNFV